MDASANLKNILLAKGFKDEELRCFCYDAPGFRAVYDQLAPQTGKAQVIDLLVKQAGQAAQLDVLQALVERHRPGLPLAELPGPASRGTNISAEQAEQERPYPEGREQGKTPSRRDVYAGYETGLDRLLNQIERSHDRYSEVLVYEQRLRENIDQSRRFGDTDTRRAERAEIIERLNELALAVLDMSFRELYN